MRLDAARQLHGLARRLPGEGQQPQLFHMGKAEVPAHPRHACVQAAQRPALQRGMAALEGNQHDTASAIFLARQIRPTLLELLLEVIAVDARELCELAECTRDFWIARLPQIRQDLEAQKVARAVGDVVRRIVAWRKAALLAVAEDVLAPRKQQRANLFPLARLHGREAIKARAAQDAHEHGLRLVIGMVRRREHIGPAALQRLPEKCVAQFARRKLYRLALRLCNSRHIAVSDKARHFALAAERSDEAGILCG